MTLTTIQAIKNKVENPDLILETSKKIIKDYLQEQLDELAKISVDEIKSFIENVATICNNEVNELSHFRDYKIFSDEKFELIYNYSSFSLNLTIHPPFPSEVTQAVIKYGLLGDGPFLERLKGLRLTVVDVDSTVIIDTVFNTPSFYDWGACLDEIPWIN